MNAIYFLNQKKVEQKARYNGLMLYFSMVEGLTGSQLRQAVARELRNVN